MVSAQSSGFATGAVLSTVFTGTLTQRHGLAVERIPTPQRLLDWLTLNDLAVPACSSEEHRLALELREAIHLAATAVASSSPLPLDAITVINSAARRGRAAPRLGRDGERTWHLGDPPRAGVADALTVIAADAIALIAEHGRSRLALCASPTCRAVFLDTSQSRTRRWCDMNTCGNRQKKARYRGTRNAP